MGTFCLILWWASSLVVAFFVGCICGPMFAVSEDQDDDDPYDTGL